MQSDRGSKVLNDKPSLVFFEVSQAMIASGAASLAEGLLPANGGYYRFNGSLTTPPCSEGVWWPVMKDPVTGSKEQIERFAHVMHHPNNRPMQPLNARAVLQ
jgi:carbonic anhydrase